MIRLLLIGVALFSANLCWAEAIAGAFPVAVTDSDYRSVDIAEAQLGQLLFYDPILSGNKEVACATCHHPKHATSDGISLGLGDGGIGLGPGRVADPDNMPEQRVPRNAPALFNLGAHEFTVLFHDGRIAVDLKKPGGIRTPLGNDMVSGFASLLSAQTMFPVLSPDEMAGHYSENDVSRAVRQGLLTGTGGAWDIIARRVADIPVYADQLMSVYSHIDSPEDIAFTDLSNAIAAFMELEWRSDTSPFDAALRGGNSLSGNAKTGMALFYGEAGCSDCHSGAFQTDHSFHAMGSPQIGPGKAARFEDHARDEGRFHVTGDPQDLYAFRTPSLRNVALTAPYGHVGSHANLEAFLLDHINPAESLKHYDPSQAILPVLSVDDFRATNDAKEIAAISSAIFTAPIDLSDAELSAMLAFLEALTDPIAMTGRLGVPDTVPSGLSVPK